MEINWDNYWDDLINKNNLVEKVEQLNRADESNGKSKDYTKNICKDIYFDFIKDNEDYDDIKSEFLSLINKIPNIHSIGSRVKNPDSLIVKIVNKRAEKFNEKTRYTNINESNYSDIITDLVGIRLILHYQGQWQDIHQKLIKIFPEKEYKTHSLVPHKKDEQFMAERPVAYFAFGDDTSQYENIIEAKLHEKGYRSIHYIISFKNTYIELQIRTIYDEAWSDYDHEYVYKKEANPNNLALKTLSPTLCKLTNAASDIGELMRNIFENKFPVDSDGKFILDEKTKKIIDQILKRINESASEFSDFCLNHF